MPGRLHMTWEGHNNMKERVLVFAAALAAAWVTGPLAVKVSAQDNNHKQDFDRWHSEFHGFVPGSIVLSGVVYVGKCGHRYARRSATIRMPEHWPSDEPERRHGRTASASGPNGERDYYGCDGELRLCQR
jgi:hypothetical protein